MRRTALGCCLYAALAGAAAASGYSDFNAGVAARSDRNRDDTIRYLSRALAAPDLPAHLRPIALYDRAEAYLLNKQYDLAVADLTSCLALAPGDYSALIQRGGIYEEQKRFDLARADFTAAANRRPELLTGYAARAQVDIDEGKYEDAIRDYDEGLKASPGDLDLILLRGEAKRMAGHALEAIGDFGKVIERDSHSAAAYMLRARIYLESGDARAAVSDYEDALDLEPDDPGLRQVAGIAQWELGRYRDAARNFTRSAADPKRAAFSYLWLYLTDTKRDMLDRDFAERAAKLDLAEWPGPILRFFIGKASEDEVLAAAAQGDADTRPDRVCDANFFLGEWHLVKSETDRAGALLGEAAKTCRDELPSAHIARREMSRLKT